MCDTNSFVIPVHGGDESPLCTLFFDKIIGILRGKGRAIFEK